MHVPRRAISALCDLLAQPQHIVETHRDLLPGFRADRGFRSQKDPSLLLTLGRQCGSQAQRVVGAFVAMGRVTDGEQGLAHCTPPAVADNDSRGRPAARHSLTPSVILRTR